MKWRTRIRVRSMDGDTPVAMSHERRTSLIQSTPIDGILRSNSYFLLFLFSPIISSRRCFNCLRLSCYCFMFFFFLSSLSTSFVQCRENERKSAEIAIYWNDFVAFNFLAFHHVWMSDDECLFLVHEKETKNVARFRQMKIFFRNSLWRKW